MEESRDNNRKVGPNGVPTISAQRGVLLRQLLPVTADDMIIVWRSDNKLTRILSWLHWGFLRRSSLWISLAHTWNAVGTGLQVGNTVWNKQN